MNIILIDPPPKEIIESHDRPDCPRLGLAYIAGFLRNKGIPCDVIDAKFGMLRLDEVEKRLGELKLDVVGITAMTHEITQADAVSRIVKRITPNAIVVIGGPHATALPVRTLTEFTNFDIAAYGEGEQTFDEIISFVSGEKDINSIKGIAYRENGDIRLNERREFISDIGMLPFPAFELFPKSTTYSIVTSRGCPFKCNFCMRVLGNKVRKRTPQNILDELERDIETFGAQYIHFWDETFGFNKKYIHELLDMMIEHKIPQRIRWDAETRVDVGDYDMFVKMKAAGCDKVGFGIESGNDIILQATEKGITKDQAINCIGLAKKAGLRTQSYFILGHPCETRASIQDTIQFATKLNTSTVAFGIMVPYPGTKICEKAKAGEGGYKIISDDWKDFNKTIGNSMELDGLPRKEIERLQLMAYMKFYLGNLRFIDFIVLFFNQYKVVFKAVQKYMKNMLSA